MTRYVWRDGNFRDPSTNEPMLIPAGNEVCMPAIRSDIAGYRSVASDKWIDGRTAQREDLKRNGCRLAEPEDALPPVCRTKKWAQRLRMDYEPPPPPPKRVTSVGPVDVSDRAYKLKT